MLAIERDLRRIATNEGCDVLTVRIAGCGHYAVEVRTPDGRAETVPASSTPSSSYNLHKFRAKVRRAVRGV